MISRRPNPKNLWHVDGGKPIKYSHVDRFAVRKLSNSDEENRINISVFPDIWTTVFLITCSRMLSCGGVFGKDDFIKLLELIRYSAVWNIKFSFTINNVDVYAIRGSSHLIFELNRFSGLMIWCSVIMTWRPLLLKDYCLSLNLKRDSDFWLKMLCKSENNVK